MTEMDPLSRLLADKDRLIATLQDRAAEAARDSKREARHDAVRFLLESPGLHFNPVSPGFYDAAERLAMFLAHGSMPAAEPKPEPKTEEPA